MDIDHECAIIIKPGNEAIIIIMLTKVSGDRAGDLDKIIYRTSKKKFGPSNYSAPFTENSL